MNTEDIFLPSRNISLPVCGQSTANAYSTFSETALGVIPGSFANLIALLLPNKLNEVVNGLANQNILANQIFVCGLVPGTTGYMCGKVFIGDWIIAINKIPITLESFEARIKRALMDNETTLELTVRSLRIDVITKFFARSNTSDVVIKFGENSHWNGLCNSLSLFPFGVMYIQSESDAHSRVCQFFFISYYCLLTSIYICYSCLIATLSLINSWQRHLTPFFQLYNSYRMNFASGLQ